MTYSFKVKNLFLCTVMVASINHASAAETGVMIDITPTANYAIASAVSKDGSTIAGIFADESWNQFAFKYDGTDVTTFGSLGADSYDVRAISADGSIITGLFSTGGGHYTYHYDGTDMVDVGSFGGQNTFPTAISDDGTVVGYTGNLHDSDVFTYDGTATNLGRMGGTSAEGKDISGDGSIIVGDYTTTLGDFHGYKYDGTTVTDLGTLGGTRASARLISNDGSIIAGVSTFDGSGDEHAFKYVGTTMTDLGTLGGSTSSVSAISNDGSVIVGSSATSSGNYHAFKYEGTTMTDLGTLGGTTSYTNDVSGNGAVIVGAAWNSGENKEAFKYQEGEMTGLGTLGGTESEAKAVSDDGTVIVGESYTSSGSIHGFVYYNVDAPSSPSSSSLIDVNNTYASLYSNGSRLNSIINLNNSSINYALNQDSTIFGENGLSVTVGSKYIDMKGVTSREMTSNVKVAYRFNNHFRAGVFLDQTLASSMPDDFNVRNPKPLVGVFATYSQRTDGTGLQARVSGAYNSVDMTITRDDSLSNTEAGQGKSKLISQGLLAQLAYGFNIQDKWQIQPYVGIRRTMVERTGYSENHGADFPITYEALNKKTTTAFAGASVSTYLTRKLGVSLSAGFEHDLTNAMDGYAGNIYYMGSFDLDAPSLRRNRGVANIRGFYDVKENQTIGFGVGYAQQALNNGDGTTVFANYTVGF